MVGRFKLTIFILATAVLALAPAASLQAQQDNTAGGRFLVLIPPFHPTQNADNGFGKDAAKKLRSLINTMVRNEPVSEDAMKKELKRFKLKEEDLDCVKTRQLASQMNAKVALCAEYHGQGHDQVVVDATFYGVGSSESFEVDQATFPKNKPDSAAQYIYHAFDRYTQQMLADQFCEQYAASQDYQNAMEQCNKALKLNPNAINARYVRAHILFEQNQYDSAMAELKKVLKQNPNRLDALQLAGYISTKQGQDQQARQYYRHYLDLNPSDVNVRMHIAYQVDTAGDPEGAMQLIDTGLKVDSTNTDLLEQYAGFAFNAALDAQNKASTSKQDKDSLDALATQYLQKAVGAGQTVFQIEGQKTRVELLRNTILALNKLNETDKAIQLAQEAIQNHPGEDQLWSAYADALHQSGQLNKAIVALDTVRKLNPSNTTASLKQGDWLINAGRLTDAVTVLKVSAAAGPKQAYDAAQLVFADAYNNGYKKNKFDYAEKGMAAALQLPNLSTNMQEQLTFWEAYSIFRAAVDEQKPSTLKTAKATLPKFQRVADLLKHVGDYPSTIKLPLKQLTANVGTYIDIQQAIIKRGR